MKEKHSSDKFYCMHDSSHSCLGALALCDTVNDCAHGDDEQFCNKNRSLPFNSIICYPMYLSNPSDFEKVFCENFVYQRIKNEIVHFSLDGIMNSVEDQTNNIENTNLPPLSLIDRSPEQHLRCHRGLDLKIWLDSESNLTATTCLCPPSYYGDRCQYQNERVSLSIQFRASSNSWQIPFAIIISLIDDNNERIIHSYEQFTYLSIRDCQIKFNIYLIYSTRPKNQTQNYSIHIDIYEKISLNYRQSLLIPITFSFLPVHRLAFIVDILQNNDSIESCSNDQCHHGKCIKYSNNPENGTFCQCDRGWSGRTCTIPHSCICSSDSLCIGVAANNRSVCVCPIHRFGSRCLLIETTCQTDGNSTCKNGGQCIPNDKYIESDQKFICICPKGFIGKRCEIVEKKILFSFGTDLVLSQSIFIHFIQVMNNNQPRRATTFRTIPFKQDSIIIYWSQPFHLVFIEFSNKNYYLTIVQKKYNPSTTIINMINPSDRCPNINEIFNETIVKLHLLRRIKYYQLPCQRHLFNLSCFYDDIHLCLCQDHWQQRVANCFEFNHNMTFDCFGQSVCENDAQCFQDTPNCPQRSMCVCPPCFYGTLCQFSSSGFGLSLDAILGYDIQPHISIPQQPHIIQTSVGLTIIFIIIGLINGIFATMTFQNKSIREVGCGLYLLGSSITTLLTTIMLGLKFWILILAQMEIIVNRSFLSFQCHSIDFILRIGLNMDQWFNALVAIERAITAIKAIQFNKKKSKQVAKIMIIILLIFVIGTNIHDPINRRLIDEENEDEKRIWCIVSYSSNLQIYNSFMNIFHFIVPFILNLISPIILITKISHQQSILQPNRTYKQILQEQLREHRHLLIAPIVLVILALPRLIISFLSKCMKSADNSWLFLAGYFISFIPPMLTFIIFILPSKFYKKEFQETVNRCRRRLHIIF
jgi:hypothetical protein